MYEELKEKKQELELKKKQEAKEEMRKKLMEEAVAEYNRTVDLESCSPEYYEMASELCDN